LPIRLFEQFYANVFPDVPVSLIRFHTAGMRRWGFREMIVGNL